MEYGGTSSQRGSHAFREPLSLRETLLYAGAEHDTDTALPPYGSVLITGMANVGATPKWNETKPRLGKDEVEVLEREFKRNPKPTTQTKRQFSEDMGVDLARINNWFQNRRAKRKQDKKQEAYEASQAQGALLYSPESFPSSYRDRNGYLSEGKDMPGQQSMFPYSPPSVAPYTPVYPDPSAGIESSSSHGFVSSLAHRPSPSMAIGSSLNSSLAPRTPMSQMATEVSKTEDLAHQQNRSTKLLPLILEERDQDRGGDDCDAVDEMSIKAERDLTTGNEVALGGVRNWLEEIEYVADVQNSTPSSDHEEGREDVILPMLDSLRKSLIDRIIGEFWLIFDPKWEAQVTRCAGNSPTSSGESSALEASDDTTFSSSQSKRNRYDDEDELPDDKGNKKPRRQTNIPGPSKGLKSRARFACPFRKHDPQKYNIYGHRVCALTHWDTVARVKEHLYRNHKTAPYCKRCWRVFETEELLDSHATVPATSICEVSEGHPPDGVTPKQVAVLKSKARPYSNQGEEDRWRQIFRLLFPGITVPTPYWEPVQEQGPLLPSSEILARYDNYMHSELPILFRSRVEEIVRHEMQPLEASLVANLDFVGLIRECQDQLSRAYQSADVRDEGVGAAQPRHGGAGQASQNNAERSRTIVSDQPAQLSSNYFEAMLQAPALQDEGDLKLGCSTFGEEMLDAQMQKETSDAASGSGSGDASGRVCDCKCSCNCFGWLMVPRTEDVDQSDPLATAVAQSELDGLEGHSIEWQSWMEGQDWGFDS